MVVKSKLWNLFSSLIRNCDENFRRGNENIERENHISLRFHLQVFPSKLDLLIIWIHGKIYKKSLTNKITLSLVSKSVIPENIYELLN